MALKGTLRGVMLQHCSWPRLAGLAGSKRASSSRSTTANSTEEVETCSLSCPEGMLATATVHAASGTAEEATVKAYAALMNVLNHQRPTFMALFTSAPHGAAVSVSSAVRQLLDESIETQACSSDGSSGRGSSGSSTGSSTGSSSSSSSTGSSSNRVPLLGCTAGRWLPPSHALVSSSTDSSHEPAVSEQRHSHRLPHYTLAAAVLPGIEAHAFYSRHDSLPPLPQQLHHFLESKPQVLVLGHPADQQHIGLLQRFENLVPGSVLAGAAAGLPCSSTTSSCAVDGPAEDLPDSDIDISNGSSSSGRGEQALNNEAKSHGRKRLHKMLTARLRQQASNVDEDMVHLSASAKLLALLDDPMFRLGKQMMAASDSSQHVEPAVLWDNQVYSEGLAGLLLMPQPTATPLSSNTSAALVRMMLGNSAKFSHGTDSLLLGQGVREELVCSAEQAAAIEPADAKQATSWQPARVTLPGLMGTGASEQQSPTELPVFGVQLSEQLWPFQPVPMTVFEERYQLLLRQLLPAAGTGAGAATHCFGIIHGGYGITAAVLVSCQGGGVCKSVAYVCTHTCVQHSKMLLHCMCTSNMHAHSVSWCHEQWPAISLDAGL